MDVFIGHIPGYTTPTDLYDFARKCSRRWWQPFSKPNIVSCEIMEVYDEESEEYEYHGLVTFKDPNFAQAAIKRLSGAQLHGFNVLVREYEYRAPGDRRFRKTDPEEEKGFQQQDRRKPIDRRRPRLKVKRCRYFPTSVS